MSKSQSFKSWPSDVQGGRFFHRQTMAPFSGDIGRVD